MSTCDMCKAKCLNQTGVSVSSCMKAICPECAGSVCENQDSFNTGFHKAIKYVEKKDRLSTLSVIILSLILLIILVWAVMLAKNSSSSEYSVLHYVAAIIFSPMYIVAYYLDKN